MKIPNTKPCKFDQCNCTESTSLKQDILYFLAGIYHTGKHYSDMRKKYERQHVEMQEIRRGVEGIRSKYASMLKSRDKWRKRAISRGYVPNQEDHHNSMFDDALDFYEKRDNILRRLDKVEKNR